MGVEIITKAAHSAELRAKARYEPFFVFDVKDSP